MKRKSLIIVIVGVVVLLSIHVLAQKPSRGHNYMMQKEGMSMMHNFSAEQMATLQTKKMTFYLDLSDSQQKTVKTIYLDISQLRKEKMQELMNKGNKPSVETLYLMASARIDKLIEVKAKLKKIFTEEQLEKWVEMHVTQNMFSDKPDFSELN